MSSLPLPRPPPSCRYLQALFALAHEADASVRKEVCTGLVALTGMVPEKVLPSLDGLVRYMLASNQHPDEAVALAAAEFWGTYQEAQLDLNVLKPYLAEIIPVLMKNMVRAGPRACACACTCRRVQHHQRREGREGGKGEEGRVQVDAAGLGLGLTTMQRQARRTSMPCCHASQRGSRSCQAHVYDPWVGCVARTRRCLTSTTRRRATRRRRR